MFKTVTTALITASLFVGCSDSGSGSDVGDLPDAGKTPEEISEEISEQVEEQVEEQVAEQAEEMAEQVKEQVAEQVEEITEQVEEQVEETLAKYEEALEVAKAELAELQTKIQDAAGSSLVGLLNQDEEGSPSLDLDALKKQAQTLTDEIAELQEKISGTAK